MPQSLARVVLHIAFSTKHRVLSFRDGEVRKRMLAYMAGVLQSLGCEAILINGVEDHLHILCNLSRTVTLARLVEEAKKANFGRCAGGTGSRSTNGMCGIEVVPPRWG